jgi:hypothetical protein
MVPPVVAVLDPDPEALARAVALRELLGDNSLEPDLMHASEEAVPILETRLRLPVKRPPARQRVVPGWLPPAAATVLTRDVRDRSPLRAVIFAHSQCPASS